MLNTDLISSVLINGVEYKNVTQSGLVLTDTLTVELDQMSIIINGISRTAFEPFTNAEIVFSSGDTYTYYVNTYTEEKINIEDNLYSYSIELISRTKILERCILPNLKIRKNISGNLKQVGWYIKNVIYPYIVRQFPFLTLNSKFENNLTMECPEIQWNHPNAKDCINDLLGTIPNAPKIVKVNGNDIDYIDLTQIGNEYSSISGIMQDENHEEMQTAANGFVFDTQNIVPDPNVPNGRAYVTPRASNSAILTTDNADIIIPNARLESVNKLQIKVRIKFVSPGAVTRDYGNLVTQEDVTLNLGEYVLEKAEYDSLPSSTSSSPANPLNYKQWHLFFEQGGNVIKGLNESSSFFLTLPSPNISRVIANAIKKHCDIIYSSYAIDNYTPSDVREMMFYVEYSSVNDARIKVVKDNEESKDTSFYGQQSQALIDYSAFIAAELEEANRMGNEEKIIRMILPTNQLFQLGDKYGDYILSKRVIAFNKEFAVFNGYFNKNYIQKIKYYGVVNRKKYTQLAQSNEMVTREEFKRYKILFSTTDQHLTGNDISTFFAKFFDYSAYDSTYKLGIVNTTLSTNGTAQAASMTPYIYSGNYKITLTCEPDDNYSVGMQVVEQDSKQVQNYVPYVDSNGECNWYLVQYYFGINPTLSAANMKNYPLYNTGYTRAFYISESYFYKDNGEKLKFTIQFDLKSNSSQLILGKEITQWNSILTKDAITKLRLFCCKNLIHENNTNLPSDSSLYELTTNAIRDYFSVTGDEISIASIFVDYALNTFNAKSIGLCTTEGEVIIALNKNAMGNIPNKIYIDAIAED